MTFSRLSALAFAALVLPSLPAAAADSLPYFGSWDCGVATMTFTPDTYDAGEGPQKVLKVEEQEGGYHIFMENDYAIWVRRDPESPNQLGWVSDASGDAFTCKLIAEGAAAEPVQEPAPAPSGSGGPETRCGWIVNPTPGNWWLTDRDGSWTIAFQGGDVDPGMDKIGDISAGDFVATNGSYGYACGCMKAVVNPELETVVKILSFKQKPIAACENDKALPAPE